MGLFDFLRGGSDQDRFAREVISAHKKRGWTTKIHYDAAGFALVLGEGHRINLHNLYNDYVNSDAGGRTLLMERVVGLSMTAKTVGADLSFEAVAGHILPSLRSRAYATQVRLQLPDADRQASWTAEWRPFCEHLAQMLFIDMEHGMSQVGGKHLEDWGKRFDDLWPLAMKNLRQQKAVRFEKDKAGFYWSDAGDFYDSSLLFLPEAFLRLELKGDPVAIVTSRTRVLVAGSDDTTVLEAMAKAAEAEYDGDSRPISCLPLVLRDGEWRIFEGDLPVIRYLHLKQVACDYENQKQVLDEWHKRNKIDDYVVSTKMFRTNEGHLFTYAILVCGIRSLMPVTDCIFVGHPDGKRFVPRRWADVMEVFGHPDIRDGDIWPPRHLFTEGATEAQFERLKQDYPAIEGLPDPE